MVDRHRARRAPYQLLVGAVQREQDEIVDDAEQHAKLLDDAVRDGGRAGQEGGRVDEKDDGAEGLVEEVGV